MSITQEIGSRIRKLRINNDYTQETMANELDITAGAYAKIERGETDPSATRLFQIAKILKVDVIALLKDEIPKDAPGKKDSVITRTEFDNLMKAVAGIEKRLPDLNAKADSGKKGVPRKGGKR